MGTSFAEVREAALKLPSVSEGTSYGTPCLRVAKSLIARLWEDGETLVLKVDPILDHVAAVSCGVSANRPVLDLDYEEDSTAEADANFVLTGAGDIVEIQATGERRGFTRAEFEALFSLAQQGIAELIALQKAAVR